MRGLIALFVTLLLIGTAHAQGPYVSSAEGYWTTTGCPTGVSPCFKYYDSTGTGVPVLSSGYDSGVVAATATPANSSHAAGVSVGGKFTIALARTAGGSGILTNVLWKSTGGSTGTLALRIWQKNPANTTCTDNVAFAGSDTDDAFLIGGGPVSLIPVAPASTTGDAATYAALTGLTYDYKNVDTTVSQNLYACAITVATDTADQNNLVRLSLSGPQN